MISYANNVARTHGLHHDGPIVQGFHQEVPALPPDLNLVCSDHFYYELGNGLEACKTACAPGTYCNVDETSNNKKLLCIKHRVLRNLSSVINPKGNVSHPERQNTGMKKKIEAPPSDLKQACSIQSPVKYSTTCEAACEASRCCFDVDSITNCYSYSDNCSACDAYRQSCSFLGPQFGGHPLFWKDPPSNLSEWCSTNTHNKDPCELACGSASCCFGDGGPGETGSYFEELIESCANYEACEALTPGDGVGSGGGSSGISFGMASSILTSVCQEMNVASAMRGECERLCRPASCC
jgi:hypothetical protein